MGSPSVSQPNELELAKKKQKERDFASLGELMRNANIGIQLLRPRKNKNKSK